MTTSDFDYDLPAELIAQEPLAQREQSRLMVVDRATGRIEHRVFAELPQLLDPSDLLALNDTRVVPARFDLRRASGGKVEGLFIRQMPGGQWSVMLRGAGRCRVGETLDFIATEQFHAQLLRDLGQGSWELAVSPAAPTVELLEAVGQVPLPPYIHRAGGETRDDRTRYQTVYARTPGAVAAPTAGLHFTGELLGQLRQRGQEQVYVTLHVGPGTFLPVKTEDLREHRMHAEWFELSAPAAEAINSARRSGRRIVAVGTTSVRVIESAARQLSANADDAAPDDVFAPSLRGQSGVRRRGQFAANQPSQNGAELGQDPAGQGGQDAANQPSQNGASQNAAGQRGQQPVRRGQDAAAQGGQDGASQRGQQPVRRGQFAAISGWTELFLYPPADLLAVDAMITNFHLPRSTLLMLVAAFADPGGTEGLSLIKRAYAEAIARRYRFYSYGDAMLIR